MDNLTTIVREEIARQYRSVRQFAFAVGVPLSTINSALHNGVGGSSFDTVMKICNALNIRLSDLLNDIESPKESKGREDIKEEIRDLLGRL